MTLVYDGTIIPKDLRHLRPCRSISIHRMTHPKHPSLGGRLTCQIFSNTATCCSFQCERRIRRHDDSRPQQSVTLSSKIQPKPQISTENILDRANGEAGDGGGCKNYNPIPPIQNMQRLRLRWQLRSGHASDANGAQTNH